MDGSHTSIKTRTRAGECKNHLPKMRILDSVARNREVVGFWRKLAGADEWENANNDGLRWLLANESLILVQF